MKQFKRGFTLIEIAVILILTTVLMMFVVNLFSTSVKSDKIKLQRSEIQKALGAVAIDSKSGNLKLPLDNTAFDNAIDGKKDIFNKDYIFYTTTIPPEQNICTMEDGTDLEMAFCPDKLCTDATSVINVALIIASNGPNNNQDNQIEGRSPRIYKLYSNDNISDDVADYYTLEEIQETIGCFGNTGAGRLRFVNTELIPIVMANAKDDYASISASDKNGVYRWCMDELDNTTNMNKDLMEYSFDHKNWAKMPQELCAGAYPYGPANVLYIRYNDSKTTDSAVGTTSFNVYISDDVSKEKIARRFYYQLYNRN